MVRSGSINPGLRSTSVAFDRLLLLVCLAATVIFTLAPFEVSISRPGLAARVREAVAVASQGNAGNAACHVAVFALSGLLFGSVYGRAALRFRAGSVAAVALFCIALEFAQLASEGRHARWTDMLGNFAGFLIGIRLAAGSPCQRLLGAIRRRAAHHPARLHAIVLLAATGIWWITGAWTLSQGLELDWDPAYKLLVGNESDRSRPWVGEIRYVGIYGRALSPGQAAGLHARISSRGDIGTRRDLGLLAGYDFTRMEGNVIAPEGAIPLPHLVLESPEGAPVREPGGGVVFTESTLLASRGPASALSAAIASAGAFSIEAWCRPFDLTQRGPARIVSVSRGIWRRNVSFGQEETMAVFRVRNRMNGPNGSAYELHAARKVQDRLQHWIAVYDHGASSLFVDGRPAGAAVDLRNPAIALGLGPRMAGILAVGTLMAMVMAIPLRAMLATTIGHDLRLHIASVLTAIALGGLPYVLASLLTGGPGQAYPLAALGAALCTAYPLCFIYVCASHAALSCKKKGIREQQEKERAT